MFDGAGSGRAARFVAPESPQGKGLAGNFNGPKEAGVAYEICDDCSGAIHVKEHLQAGEIPLSGQYMSHPSIASLVNDGYQNWVL